MARLKENGLMDDARYAKQFGAHSAPNPQSKGNTVSPATSAHVHSRPPHLLSPPKKSPDFRRTAWSAQRIERKLRLVSWPRYRKKIDEKNGFHVRELAARGFFRRLVRRELKR